MIAPWAEEEMNTPDFGDERLDARVITLVSALGSRPNLSIPAACKGRKEMVAAYRFFNNDKVTFAKVLEPQRIPDAKRIDFSRFRFFGVSCFSG